MDNININLSEFGGVIAALLVVGMILKNAFPTFPNRFIPLLTWVLGMVAYLTLTNGWQDPKQWLAAIVAAATATGTHSAIKNSTQKEDSADAKPFSPLNKIPIIFLALTLFIAPMPVVMTGCVTTGQVIATSSTTVDHAMQAWAVYVVDGKATPEQENQVRILKNNYDQAEDIVTEAYATFKVTGDKTQFTRAKELLLSKQTQLIALVSAITGEKL